MFNYSDDEVLATISASPGRRFLGLTSLALLGAMLLYIAVVTPPELVWQLVLMIIGGCALWLANAMRTATANTIELTPSELRDSSGEVIAKIEDIVSIDRGFFAFKPSNGFLVRTKRPAPRIWRPGLWWRIGRQIGVGGMTPGHQSKFMSEILATILAQREMDQP